MFIKIKTFLFAWLLHRNTPYFISFILLSVSTAIVARDFPSYFVFTTNPYAAISAVGMLLNGVLLVVIQRCKGSFQSRLWFSVSIVGSIMLNAGQLLERISTSPLQALFWSHLEVFGYTLIPVGFYMFAYFFTAKKNSHQVTLVSALLLGVAGALFVLTLNDNAIRFAQASYGPGGFVQPLSTALFIFIVWLAIIVLLAIFRFIAYNRGTIFENQKRLSRIVIICASIALAGAMYSDVIPRFFGFNVVPLGFMFQSILPIGVIYAIYRYDNFAVDFSTIAVDILDTLPEVILITDSHFTVLMANRYTFEFSQFTKQELYFQTVKHLLQPDSFNAIRHGTRSQFRNATKAVFENVTFVTKTGFTMPAYLTVTKLSDSTPMYLLSFVDLSQQKQYNNLEQQRNKELELVNQNYRNQQQAMVNLLEDSRELSEQLQQEKAGVEKKVKERTAEVRAERARLEASINSLDVGFLMVDKNTDVLTVNAAYKTIINEQADATNLGVSRLSNLLGETFNIEAAIASCLKTGTTIIKDNVKLGIKEIHIYVAPIFEDAEKHLTLGAVVVIEDITEAKAAERSRDEFFSIASHELRTPLTAIRGNTSMMMEYYKEQLSDPDLKEMVDDIHDSSIRLITIVNDFLDTSRLEQGKISFKLSDFNVNDLVAEVIQEFEAGEVNTAISIKIAPVDSKLPRAHADRDRLKQTIINLVGNACKFTERGGVTVKVHNKGRRIFIEVSDTGKGIPLESQNLLFRKFQQATNNILTRDSTRSTGLGLYISRLIIEGMGGRIYLADSSVNKGSTFTIEIPAAHTAQKS